MTPTVILLLFLCSVVEFTLTLEECSELPSVEHAFVLDEYKRAQYHKGDVIYFCCDPGYTTGLNTTYICTERGWRAAIFSTCVDETVFKISLGCTHPPPLQNGNVSQNSIYVFENGQSVGYQCDRFYKMKGGFYKTCTNGQWTGDIQCVDICSELPAVANAQLEDQKDTYQRGDVVHYVCNVGYTSEDQIRYVCSDDGWSRVHAGVCTLKPCAPPDNIPNGYYQIIAGEDLVFGTSIKYFCNEGYVMMSREDTQTCSLSGWSNSLPHCIKYLETSESSCCFRYFFRDIPTRLIESIRKVLGSCPLSPYVVTMDDGREYCMRSEIVERILNKSPF